VRRRLPVPLLLLGVGTAVYGPTMTPHAAAAPAGVQAKVASAPAPVTLRLGYFPNLTHATALVGVQNGIFSRDLGPGVTLQTATFNAGPAEVEAIFSGALDAGYMGPNPAINAFLKSHGQAVRVVAGATSGGAGLVVRSGIASAAQLKGTRLATPQLGNTQDVALRHWLSTHGLSTTTSGGGDVSILPEENSQTVQAFETGQIDGAWVPEPYLSTLEQVGGKLLVNERSLWPHHQFATTLLVVSTAFLHAHPDVVHRLLMANVDATSYLNSQPVAAQVSAAQALGAITGKSLKPAVVSAAWSDLTFTVDPEATSLRTDAQRAAQLGFITSSPRLSGLFDLGPLNQILRARGSPAVRAA
jgi:NitT/TauT family transport system substrate-binding protein